MASTLRCSSLYPLSLVVSVAAACQGAPALPPGALVEVAMDSRVGVLLDELPAAARERVATELLARPADFWRARAERQVQAALYRLVYRNFYGDDLGQLPLPPVERWGLTVEAPARTTIDGHDLVAAAYHFDSTLLTAIDEPARADARLGAIGGVVEEPFVLPADPEHLLERTGFACMNESDFPPSSVDTENALAFFDDTCEAGEAEDGCHLTAPIPTASCSEALAANVGRVEASFRFERLAWDAARADAARVGEVRAGGAQLQAVGAGLDDHRIVYRFFPAGSCAIVEGCVGAPGWRRLLQFTATMHNVGDTDAALGDVGPESAVVANHLVSFSECHQHMHFNHYGRFTLGSDANLGSKRAFCLESTSRYFNNETTPLVHPYSCEFQGTARGWGDDYIAGLDCQWIDITSIPTASALTAPLAFEVNPDGFLCEGAQVLDDAGAPRFEPTEFVNEQGEPENRFMCDAFSDAGADNLATTSVTVPAGPGGLVTEPCRRFQIGPTRNCGFVPATSTQGCPPLEIVTLECSGGTAAIRVCEASQALGPIPCTHNDALGVATVDGGTAPLEFRCPSPRSESEPGGRVALFVGPLVDGDDVSAVTCRVLP